MTRIAAAVVGCLALAAWLGVTTARGDRAGAAAIKSPAYAAIAQPIAFDHSSAAHHKLTCESCHRARPTRAQAPEDHRPSETACLSCHADRIDRNARDAAHCGYCHRGFDPQRVTAPQAAPLRPARLRFDHSRHAKTPCVTCHASVDGQKTPELPSMSSCFSCHDGKRTLACNGCHLSTPSGRLRTQFGDEKLKPQSAFLGMAHDADFSVRHRWIAADQGAVCATCHTESECAACHDGARKPRSIHPNDYLVVHAQDAQRNATRCTSCHATTSFCSACHARLGIAQISSPDIASPRRFHPPSSQWLRGPVLHAREAQRSLASCVSCHAERDCVDCHGARGVGAGLSSPHPPGFANADCARALARGARACLQCHRASDAALRACR